MDYEGKNFNEITTKSLIERIRFLDETYGLFTFEHDVANISRRFGEKHVKHYNQVLADFLCIDGNFIDESINTLCYIYPDILGEFYKKYIDVAKRKASIYLKNASPIYNG